MVKHRSPSNTPVQNTPLSTKNNVSTELLALMLKPKTMSTQSLRARGLSESTIKQAVMEMRKIRARLEMKLQQINVLHSNFMHTTFLNNYMLHIHTGM